MTETRKPFRLGISCLGVSLVFCAIIVFLDLCFPSSHRTPTRHQRICANNLMQLGRLASVFARTFGGPQKQFPTETGKAFWLKLTETDPPLISSDALEVLVCPDLWDEPKFPFTTYAGPSKDVNTLKPEDIMGGCRCRDHPDGIVFLRKNGEILFLKGGMAERLIEQIKD